MKFIGRWGGGAFLPLAPPMLYANLNSHMIDFMGSESMHRLCVLPELKERKFFFFFWEGGGRWLNLVIEEINNDENN